MDSSGSEWDPVVGSRDHSNRPLDSTKKQGISLTAKQPLASHEGVCSVYLVTLDIPVHKKLLLLLLLLLER